MVTIDGVTYKVTDEEDLKSGKSVRLWKLDNEHDAFMFCGEYLISKKCRSDKAMIVAALKKAESYGSSDFFGGI